MIDATPHAVLLCHLLRHALEHWAARGSRPEDAALLVAVLWVGRDGSDRALWGARQALDDAEDAVTRARDHLAFMAAPPRLHP